MGESDRGPESDQTSGWGDLASLEIRHRVDRKPEKFSFGWPVSIWVLLCAGFGALVAFRVEAFGSVGGQTGYLLGSFIGMWLMAYAGGWVVYRLAGRSLSAGRVTVCVLVTLSAIGTLGRVVDHRQQEQQAYSALAKDLRGAVTAMSQGNDGSSPMVAPVPAVKLQGDTGELQAFMNDYFKKVIALHNDYQAELAADGWGSLLDPARMQGDVGMAESKAILARGRATVAKYRQRWIGIFKDTVAQVDAMDGGSSMKRGFAAGFHKTSGKANADAMQIWDMEAEVVTTADNLINYLDKRSDAWKIKSGKFVFADAQSLSEFNAYLDRIDQLVAKEKELRGAGRANAEKYLQQFEAKTQ